MPVSHFYLSNAVAGMPVSSFYHSNPLTGMPVSHFYLSNAVAGMPVACQSWLNAPVGFCLHFASMCLHLEGYGDTFLLSPALAAIDRGCLFVTNSL